MSHAHLRRPRRLLFVVLALACLLVPSQALASPRYLPSGATLYAGQSKSTGQFKLVMQYDGNLVVYNQSSRALWNSRTASYSSRGWRAVMQGDGNLVIVSPTGTPVWSTRTAGRPGAYLVLQDDANLVVKQGSTPVWASGTVYHRLHAPDSLYRGNTLMSPNGRYVLAMQGDGNLVLYNRARGVAIWATHTGSCVSRAQMQFDGNFVLYANRCFLPDTVASWATHTAGRNGAYLNLQGDGNLVLYQGATPVWASHTAGH